MSQNTIQWDAYFQDDNGNTFWEGDSPYYDDDVAFKWRLRQRLEDDGIVWYADHDSELGGGKGGIEGGTEQWDSPEDAKADCQKAHDHIIATEEPEAPEEPAEGWRPDDKILLTHGGTLPGTRLDFSGGINVMYAEKRQDDYQAWLDMLTEDELIDDRYPRCKSFGVVMDVKLATVDEHVRSFRDNLTMAIKALMNPEGPLYTDLRKHQDEVNLRVAEGEKVLQPSIQKHSHFSKDSPLGQFHQHRDKMNEQLAAAPE